MGNSTRLECKYDLQGEKLYTVKWYKDGNEFYRFLPGESPEVQIFDVTGVHVDVSPIFFYYKPKRFFQTKPINKNSTSYNIHIMFKNVFRIHACMKEYFI